MLIRGEVTGLYPYYFLDTCMLGYGQTLLNGLGMLFGFGVVSLYLLIVAHGQRRDRKP